MTREQAAARVAKLQVLADPARGGTPAECATAATKARALIDRYGLTHQAARPRASRSGRRPRRGPAFTAPTRGAAWAFDVSTGEHSANVKVVSYQDRANWKIEVEL